MAWELIGPNNAAQMYRKWWLEAAKELGYLRERLAEAERKNAAADEAVCVVRSTPELMAELAHARPAGCVQTYRASMPASMYLRTDLIHSAERFEQICHDPETAA